MQTTSFARRCALLTLLPVVAALAGEAGDSETAGRVGRSYVSVAYARTWRHERPSDASGAVVALGSPLRDGLDFTIAADGYATGSDGGARFQLIDTFLGLRGYAVTDWGRPYLELAAGGGQAKSAGVVATSSAAYRAGAGVEFGVTPDLAVTPYCYAEDYSRLRHVGAFHYGLRAEFRLGEHAAVTCGYARDSRRDDQALLGFTFRL